MPTTRAAARSRHQTPDGLLLVFPKRGHALARDFEWLGSHRFGIIHLGGRGEADLRERSLDASARIGWHPPYAATGDAPLSEVGPIDAGWSPTMAQNPDTGLKPVNALADGDDRRVLLTGHELAASFTEGWNRVGSSEHRAFIKGCDCASRAPDKRPRRSTPTRPDICPGSSATAPTASFKVDPGAAMPTAG